MHFLSKGTNQRQSKLKTMFFVSLHLLKRMVTGRFCLGLFVGIAMTICISYPRSASPMVSFRADQSKFEYEKNQLNSLNISSPMWNGSWDK
jgi:hypothetical protein